MTQGARTLGWVGILRLGLVQMCLGSIVVLTTSTLNRLMIVEMGLAAIVPGALVALHYGVQLSRPRWGFASDAGGRRTRFVIGGMAVLGLGAVTAAAVLPLFATAPALALTLSVAAYAAIGLGVGASGTSLLAMLATGCAPHRRAAAATITWLMMILGIALTAGIVGALIEPYSHARLLTVVAATCALALALTTLATWGVEARLPRIAADPQARFRDGLAEVWADPRARRFTLFVALSMTAYFMQELILEPFAGLVFEMTPGQTTQLSGAQNGGVFLGMAAVGLLATGLRVGSLRAWVVAGCLGSTLALAAIATIGAQGAGQWMLPATVALGAFNGMFAVAAIGAMMQLATEGMGREGTRMGVWGAAQAIAAGFGGLTGAALADLGRVWLSDAQAFGAVFLFEAALFTAAALMAARIMAPARATLVPGE
ncbi:MAG: BCD family MFS transporter [Paracoccaceae bacterium]